MDKDFLEQQLKDINSISGEIKGENNKGLENKLQIIRSFVLSLICPQEFNDIQREDLRKLAKELNYDGTTEFNQWWQSKQYSV